MIHVSRNHSISGVFLFLLLGIFAVFGTLLVLLGTNAYRSSLDLTAIHDDTRIVETFVRHTVRGQDVAGQVSVQKIDGLDVLILGDPDDCASYIYVYDGTLYELYTSNGFSVGDGEEICKASGFGAMIDGNVLRVMISTEDGNISIVNTAIRCVQ